MTEDDDDDETELPHITPDRGRQKGTDTDVGVGSFTLSQLDELEPLPKSAWLQLSNYRGVVPSSKTEHLMQRRIDAAKILKYGKERGA